MNLHADHRKRMRERFAENGFSGYHPHEVMEQVLFEILPRVNTNEIGHRLIRRFGSIENVLRASPEELDKIEGIGPKSAEFLASLINDVSEMILAQYRTVAHLSVYQVAFLADWFMRGTDPKNIGLIVCDSDYRFLDFKFLFEDMELERFDGTVTTEIFDKLCQKISEKVCVGTYILVMKDTVLEKSVIYRLLDETRKRNQIMLNAYRLENKRPVSVIFTN